MRINLRQTKPMKRDLVYTTDDWRLRPFDPTRVFASSPHQNRQFAPPVEKVGLGIDPVSVLKSGWQTLTGNRRRGASTLYMQVVRTLHGRSPSEREAYGEVA